MSNKEVAAILRNVATAYTIKDEKKFLFQILAYKKAAESVDGLSVQLTDLYKQGKLQEVSGIGPTIRSRLEELFETGKVSHWEEVTEGIPTPVFVLMGIPSFGPKKAYRLAEEFDLRDAKTAIDDVYKIAKKGGISSLAGFGEKSEKDIMRAIDEYRMGFGKTTRMVLPYASDIGDEILRYLRKSNAVNKAEVLGSLRRRMPTVGDIDIAVASDEPKEVIEHFVSYPIKQRVIEKGPSTASLLISGGHQVDLMVQPPARFGSLLQHFTGSKDHNVALREYALRKGISLSERGFKRKSKEGEIFQEFDSEEKFYNALGMDWIPPEIRENTGEIELAIKHQLPKLVQLSDIKGDFHLHSSFPLIPSHDKGHDSIYDMTQKAMELGYDYIGFSEHNPAVSKNSKNKILDLIKARNEEIDKVSQKFKNIKILKGMETDITPAGALALPNTALDILDYTIVSIHSVFKTQKKEMTKRVLSGFSHPKAKILAHPTGRILNRRNGYELDFEDIFEFAKKNNKALEINAFPNRLDLPDPLIRKAVKHGVNLIINTDSHRLLQMELMGYGVSIAQRGWATKKNIINTLPIHLLLEWFKR